MHGELPAMGIAPNPGHFAGKHLDTDRQILHSFTAADGNPMYGGIKLRRIGANQFNDADIGTVTSDDSQGAMKARIERNNGIAFAGSRY